MNQQAPKKLKGIPLGVKMIVTNLLLVVLIVIPLGYIDINSKTDIIIKSTEKMKTTRIENMKRSGITNAKNIASTCSKALADNDYTLLRGVIPPIVESDKEIAFGMIIDTDRRVISHNDKSLEGEILSDEITQEVSKSKEIITKEYKLKDEDIIEISAPITYNEKRLGTVRFGYTKKYLNEEIKAEEKRKQDAINSSLIRTGLIGLTFLLIGSLIAVIQSISITRPIKLLSNKAQLMSEGVLGEKVDIKSKDEVGLLADAFNEMSGSLATFYSVTKAIGSSLDLDKVIDSVFDSIGKMMEYDTCAIFLVDPEKNELYIRAGRGFKKDISNIRFKVGEGIAGTVAKDQKPILIQNTELDPRFVKKGTSSTKSVISVPLTKEKKTIGVLSVDSHVVNGFKEGDLRLLTSLGEQIAIAIDNAGLYEQNALLYEKTKKANKDLQAIHDAGITMSAMSLVDLDMLLDNIINIACNIINAERGSIMLIDEASQELVVRGVKGLDKNLIMNERVKMNWGLAGQVVTTKKPILVKSADDIPDLKTESRSRYLTSSFVIVPLEIGDKVLGVFNVTDKKDGKPFDEDDLALLTALSTSMAIAIDNARLYQHLAEKERMEQELRIATNIQMSLLPKEMPFVKGLEVYGLMKPAKEVGGDYFDFISRNGKNEELNVCIGDVAGKGIPAGIVMVMARSVIHSLIQTHTSTKTIITEANRLLKGDIGLRRFMTMLMFYWNYKDGVLKYTSAGHERIIVYRAKTGKCETFRAGGLALGIEDDLSPLIQEREIKLEDGDKILLYTDGVTEARNSNNEMFSLNRLIELVEKYGANKIDDVLNLMYRDIKQFIGSAPQYDDITLVGIQKSPKVIPDKDVLIEHLEPIKTGETEKYFSVTVIDVNFNLDIKGVELLDNTIKTLLKENRHRIIVDMSSVSYINSSGLGLLLQTLKEAKKMNGKVKFFGLTEYVRDIMELLNLTLPFTIFNTREEAINALHNEELVGTADK